MKVCPTCQQKYADSLQFCLSDGTVLSVFNDSQPTSRLEFLSVNERADEQANQLPI